MSKAVLVMDMPTVYKCYKSHYKKIRNKKK